MRNKIDYGIDLGTTNSAIARMENGVPVIQKNEFLKDTTPSCINFGKKKNILIGDMAIQAMKYDAITQLRTFEKAKSNSYIEFKRTMGTAHRYESSRMETSFSSEDLSAEVLKKLKSLFPDEHLSSIVITVPAKFLIPQIEATQQAAKLAGFNQVELLQEPVAAAIAYGLNTNDKEGFWLVFDFGGGTFDAALIKANDGFLTVKDTDGDNWLGGKNIDEAIIDQIILPYLQQHYSIESILEDDQKRDILRNAIKSYAEEAKIQLSYKDSHNILSDLGDLPFEDDNGNEPEIDILVTQLDLEPVVAPKFQKAIDITKDLLKRNNLKGTDIGALILVGGPTYSPILRKMLKEQITDKLDASIEPMTVVAKGAAIYASTVSVSDEVVNSTINKDKLQLDIMYESTTVELEELVNIKIIRESITATFSDKIYMDVIRYDNAWSSRKIPLSEKATIVDVELVKGRANTFTIYVYDERGNKIEFQPSQFTILQGISINDKLQTLPYNIGIGKHFPEYEEDRFVPVKGLDKNNPVPATSINNTAKTRSVIRPGKTNDIIRIPIYQGDYNAYGTSLILNNLVYEVIISGEKFPALLPEGSDVEITIKVDRSQLMKFSAYFPLIDHIEELEIEIKPFIEPWETAKIEKEILKAKQKAMSLDEIDLVNRLDALEKLFHQKKGSDPGKMEIQDGLRKELFKLELSQKKAEWPRIEQELKDSFYELEELIEKIKMNGHDDKLNMEKVEAHLSEFRDKVEIIIKGGENTIEAKRLISEINSLDFHLRNAVTGNALDVQFLHNIDSKFGTYRWKDKNKARQLCNQGLQLAENGNNSAIRPILVQLVALMHDDEKPRDTLR
jgi:molecular chaperone DnaK